MLEAKVLNMHLSTVRLNIVLHFIIKKDTQEQKRNAQKSLLSRETEAPGIILELRVRLD